MVTPTLLLIGQEGQVAWELRRTLACLGRVVALGRATQPALDLLQPNTLRQALREIRPNIIVNAAAYTAVDKAESEPDAAQRINAKAVGVLAEEARAMGIGLVHYSTDYVISGLADRPYVEDDPTDPLGVYGRSKLAGEEAIRATGVPHLILRTAWVYGRRGQNFLLTMLRLMREREQLGIVADQFGAPTWSRLIAEATALMLAFSRRDGRLELGDVSGTYHLTCQGQTSWHGFAEAIREIGLERGLLGATAAKLKSITTSEYPTPARRPGYSVLSNRKLQDRFGLVLPDWRDALDLCLAEITLN
jgi:dTDP-4-dehydrorhamnose reductase